MSSPKRLLLLLIFLSGKILLYSQEKTINREKYKIQIFRSSETIKIDGLLDEKSWQVSEQAENFVLVTPIDTGYATAKTTVVITYDKSNIYVGAVCYDPLPGKRPVESLRRDFEFGKNDNFRVHIDTYNNLTNGFAFGVSAAGAQSEGVINNGNQSSFIWDTKWKSAVKSYDDRWVAEMAIPFRSLRYFEGEVILLVLITDGRARPFIISHFIPEQARMLPLLPAISAIPHSTCKPVLISPG
jgi:hypothetical protein